MWLFLKKLEKIGAIILLTAGLLVPVLIFLNRFLIPDVSFDSLNYHLYLGFKGFNPQNNSFEFYPTGIHNFSPAMDMPGYVFFKLLGYRLGSIFSLLAVYLAIWGLYRILKLLKPEIKITEDFWAAFLFVSSFLSFELFLGIASYYNDGLSAVGGVWAIYYLLKYLKSATIVDLIRSAGILSLLLWGKQTNIYLTIGMGLFLTVYLLWKNNNWQKNLRQLIIFGSLALLLPAGWYLKNYVITGNPIFPFYNAVFKSIYFEPVSFREPQFGGSSLAERLIWGLASVKDPARLGQVHDLFNDYKINLYFVMAIIFLIMLLIKKKQESLLTKFILIYLIIFELWCLIFGYLRYALVLEYLGGLALLLLFYELKGWWKWVVFVPIFVFLVLQNKRVINLSLAYDISFRPGYFYNRLSYPKEAGKIFENKLDIDDTNPADIYLNCSAGGMTYYVLSPFTDLPVVNIDMKAYRPMTSDPDYEAKVKERLRQYLGNKEEITFVSIAAKAGLNTEHKACVDSLSDREWQIDSQQDIDFLGYEPQKLELIRGRIDASYFDKIVE